MRFTFILSLLGLITTPAFGQVMEEVNPPENIKSVVFKGPTEDQFPVIRLGESMTLEFDDLTANEQDYYYRIVHCDYDWTPSQLLKSQYISGADNQRIIDYENSYTTLQPYSNYRLTIPNNNVKLTVSGNFVLEIYNSYGDLQFSRRFVVYRDAVSVAGAVKRSRDFNFINTKQVVQFTINTASFNVVNPKKEVKVAIIQNHHWPTALYNIKPQFTIGTELVYKYNEETSFFGGNEYLNFDTKDLRSPNFAISNIEMRDVYHHYLFTNEYRYDKEYTYFPDINGDFVVRTLQGEDVSREAEYSKVHFSLPYTNQIGLDNVYVIGKFNNYALGDGNRMTFNESTGKFEATLMMKQGFYNYKYVVQREDGTIEPNLVSGNFHFTENNYLILVYYRDFGDMYDSIIGIGSVNSRNISN
ncbi:type IX secretion system plug protein domain-containing protein [Flagellimonas halotolerans]|uniref:Type IX secretion system plug protein domain-containing protein n=1 Tax=Flagellimonas halotolerans TaxID=3112164 RepID=A0ABU6IQ61_9FLAO|nr:MULTISPECIES: type IX secretion system plug protein domain-containing protein [unclassified Allomuricauda]MEC3965392.1 type IX secretion system plug protein domain-containing protein [Muricauda sp. SYSU M86414]MEC4265258.1 type IX secretion system plug protein domain-containing protein [Muricauda sp. SYSU M84420]